MPGALVTLLALFFAFVVSMAEVRFESRRQIVVDEATAIDSTLLKSKFLPEPEHAEITHLIKEYVDERLKFYRSDQSLEELRDIRQDTSRLEMDLWSHAIALSRAHPESIPVGDFNDSLNSVFVTRDKQTAAYKNHVPDNIIALLIVNSILVMASVGYAAGVSGGRHLIFSFTLSLIIALTLYAILDIDRPRGGLAQVDYRSMESLQKRAASY
jgi:hypothetical protein